MLTEKKVKEIITEATDASRPVWEHEHAANGDRGACGFAWVNLHSYEGKRLDGRSAAGRILKKAGISQDYRRVFQIWNAGGYPGQSVDTKVKAARVFADVFAQHGFDASVGSRLD